MRRVDVAQRRDDGVLVGGGLGLDIGCSRVATEADRVADVFYVRGADGRKIEDAARLDS
jgi:UTP:GlnB (protein PII) uridylyltransferase